MVKVQFSQKMHDQEIMDWLEDEIGEDAVVAFGDALPEHAYPDDKELITKVLNEVLQELGSTLELLECINVDDDGYTWRVKSDQTL